MNPANPVIRKFAVLIIVLAAVVGGIYIIKQYSGDSLLNRQKLPTGDDPAAVAQAFKTSISSVRAQSVFTFPKVKTSVELEKSAWPQALQFLLPPDSTEPQINNIMQLTYEDAETGYQLIFSYNQDIPTGHNLYQGLLASNKGWNVLARPRTGLYAMLEAESASTELQVTHIYATSEISNVFIQTREK